MLTQEAAVVWNSLKGIICVYKPADVTCNRIRKTLIFKLSSELNELECRPPTDYVSIEGNPSKQLSVIRKPSLADHTLVVGPRYVPDDIRCTWSSFLGFNTSGVLLLGLQEGTKTAFNIRLSQHIRTYRVKGMLGLATDNYYKDGKIVEKSTFRSIKIKHMEALLSSIQAAHQKKMFELSGVDIQSQTAYELAVRGPIRPSQSSTPVIYGIKCVDFQSPEFTIEVHCVNEYEMYLKALIQEIGIKLNSTAHCTGLQCIRHSYFGLDHALLRKHWTLQNVMTNLAECQIIMNNHSNINRQENIELQT